MTRVASVLWLAVILCVATPAVAQQAPAPAAVTPTRQVFRSLQVGMTRDQASKLVASQGPMDLQQETWGRWTPGTKPGEVEVLRIHFFDNQVYWIEYDAFGDSWIREEKGGCDNWVKIPLQRVQEKLKLKEKR